MPQSDAPAAIVALVRAATAAVATHRLGRFRGQAALPQSA
jgi:hypothetical protein